MWLRIDVEKKFVATALAAGKAKSAYSMARGRFLMPTVTLNWDLITTIFSLGRLGNKNVKGYIAGVDFGAGLGIVPVDADGDNQTDYEDLVVPFFYATQRSQYRLTLDADIGISHISFTDRSDDF